ncbi:MAG: phospholipase D-like domain-containing protein [Acidobacteriota bacterium]
MKPRTGKSHFRLITQPDDGISPLLEAIDKAKKRIDILIFRFDRAALEEALVRAVERGVSVQALIAWTNRGGEKHLRDLEARLLGAGVTVSRTASDLTRYHGKMLLVDGNQLLLLAFNFTGLDIDRSRSFGLITAKRKLVLEAKKLFEADTVRQPYKPGSPDFIVSPLNARERLAAFIEGAKKELLIYDPGLGDPQMVRLLEERNRAGVRIRIIGEMKRASPLVTARPLARMRLHTRTIVRDGRDVFVGSQSLRAAELDGRREIGIVLSDRQIAESVTRVFEEDWKLTAEDTQVSGETLQGDKLAKKVAKAVVKDMPPVMEVLEAVAEEVSGGRTGVEGVDLEKLEEAVRTAVKTAVKEAIQSATGPGIVSP